MNEILDQLISLLSSGLSSRGVTRFFKGKQDYPAKSDMPMVMVYPISTKQSHSGTVRDDAEFQIGIRVVVDLKQYFDNTNGQGNELDALTWLMKIVEERETDGDAKSTTIFSVINSNIQINDKVLYTDDVSIQYEPYYTNGEFPVARADVEFTAHARPNRT